MCNLKSISLYIDMRLVYICFVFSSKTQFKRPPLLEKGRVFVAVKFKAVIVPIFLNMLAKNHFFLTSLRPTHPPHWKNTWNGVSTSNCVLQSIDFFIFYIHYNFYIKKNVPFIDIVLFFLAKLSTPLPPNKMYL